MKLTFTNRDVLDQLLLQSFGAKVGGASPPSCHASMTIPLERNFVLHRSSRATLSTVGKMNTAPK